ncbi:hypothetical protein [Embleya hyalina]|uniref:Uncharacterized protein n=1 Tax=Embleya hyalina TaxID=516124 RepID=A0A401YM09_9ACTN|nr:hypothetical protein [Embleya hyalina]GCD95640.1 hypothetical protein EHYA_03315 [Embleya hyalina]
MSEAPVEKWHLAMLRVRLDLGRASPIATVELLGFPPEGPTPKGPRTYWRGDFDYGGFGLSEGVEPPCDPTVPDDLVEGVVGCLSAEFPADTALWLRLVPPYGHLGGVPWEGALVAAAGRPLVRVPDRLPPGSDPGRMWTVAVALSTAPDAPWVAGYLSAFVASLRACVAGRVDVHVFTERGGEQALRALLSTGRDGDLIHVHDPDGARRYARSGPPRPDGPGPATGPPLWGNWIAGGLDGKAVRALHIVTDGTFDGIRPVLSVNPDPATGTDRSTRAFVTADRVRRLADRVGATVLSLGSPPDNPCDSAIRMMADHIGLRRAGPTFYSSVARDPAGYALAQAHAFIAGEPGTVPIPRDPSLFVHLQPEFVGAALRDAWPDPEAPGMSWLSGRAPIADSRSSTEVLPHALGMAGGDEITARYANADSVPMWVASSTRYIENQVASLVRTAGVPGETPAAKQAYDLGVGQAIAELRALVDERIRET